MARIRFKACRACQGDLAWLNRGWVSGAGYMDNWVWACLQCSREHVDEPAARQRVAS